MVSYVLQCFMSFIFLKILSSILLPPLFSGMELGADACLHFKYHMYGFHVRELKAYVESSQGGSLKSRWELFSITGNQGNEWHHAQINFYFNNGARVSHSFQNTVTLCKENDLSNDKNRSGTV